MFKTATYIRQGEGKSRRARMAESHGVLPLTQAAKVVAVEIGLTQAAAKALLKLIGRTEWHHSGKYAKEVDYYDTEVTIDDVAYLDEQEVRATGKKDLIYLFKAVDRFYFTSEGYPIR